VNHNEKNPFHYGSMITDPEQFVGRRDELATVTDRLNSSQVQGSAIYGPRRIGKSSLLHYLYRPRDSESLRANDELLVIYLSAQDSQCSTPAAFRATLMLTILDDPRLKLDGRTTEGRILKNVKQSLADGEPCDWVQAKSVLENLPKHPVICLDEFEGLLTDEFDDRFFNALRDWANNGYLTWITASVQTLKALGDARNSTSPFFNLLANVELGDLAPDEVDPLLDWSNATVYPFTPRERRIIKRVALCNPYHLQIVAAWMWLWMWLRKKQRRWVFTPWARTALKKQIDKPAPMTDERPKLPWPWHLFYIGIILLLIGAIWYDPLALHEILHECQKTILFLWAKLRQSWQPVGSFVQNLEAWILLLGLPFAIWKRKSILDVVRPMWDKSSGLE